jgi:hypothetical protein
MMVAVSKKMIDHIKSHLWASSVAPPAADDDTE